MHRGGGVLQAQTDVGTQVGRTTETTILKIKEGVLPCLLKLMVTTMDPPKPQQYPLLLSDDDAKPRASWRAR